MSAFTVKVRDQDLAEAIAKRRLGLLHQVGVMMGERWLHPRKLTWIPKKMVWKSGLLYINYGRFWMFLVSMLVFGSVNETLN